MIDGQLRHWEVVDVGCCQRPVDAQRSGRNEAIGLVEGDTPPGELTPPGAGPNPLGRAQWSEAKTVEQTARDRFLSAVQTTPDFLHRYRAYPRLDAGTAQPDQALCSWPAAEGVDENGRVDQKSLHSARPASVATPLGADPLRGIIVPIVADIVEPT